MENNNLLEMIRGSWKNVITWECDEWCLNEGPTELLYDEAAKAMKETKGDQGKASRLLAVKIKEAVEEARPLKGDDFFSLALLSGLQAIDYKQIATAIIGALEPR